MADVHRMGFPVLVCLFESGHFKNEVLFAFVFHQVIIERLFKIFPGDGYPYDIQILNFGTFSDVSFSNCAIAVCFRF